MADREYRVYVLGLKKSVWDESKKFRDENPDYIQGKPMVYVGSTGQTIDERLQDHLSGHNANEFVTDYFKKKRPDQYKGIRPRKSRSSAEAREARLALELKGRGWAVWQR